MSTAAANPSRRTLSPRGLALLKSFEGVRGGFAAERYLDAAGVWTIGWGHAIRRNEAFPDPIDEARADALLRADLATTEIFVAATSRVALADCEFDALVVLVFNIGIGNYDRSTLRQCLYAGDKAGVAKQWVCWDRAGGRVLRGLTIRRCCELMMFQGGSSDEIAALRARLELAR